MNPFLSQYGYQLFEGMRGVENFPCEVKGNKVIYMSCSELMALPEKKLTEAIVIFDEIDRCYQDQILTFSKTSVPNQFVIKYPPKVLRICKQVIGFTGTLGTSTIKQKDAFQTDKKKFESISV